VPPSDIVQEFKGNRVVFLMGDVDDLSNLREAGAADVRTVVIFRNKQQTKLGNMLMDSNTIHHTCSLDSLLIDSRRDSITICDLVNSDSLNLLHSVAKDIGQKRIAFSRGTTKRDIITMTDVAVRSFATSSSEDADVLLMHPRFASVCPLNATKPVLCGKSFVLKNGCRGHLESFKTVGSKERIPSCPGAVVASFSPSTVKLHQSSIVTVPVVMI